MQNTAGKMQGYYVNSELAAVVGMSFAVRTVSTVRHRFSVSHAHFD